MKTQNYLVVALSFIFVVGGVLFVKKLLSYGDIDIRSAETEEELVVSANFPRGKSKQVHDYVRAHLRMTDITDMQSLEIKNYQTPDARMHFYIRSEPGYIKIVLDRTENDTYAYNRLKQTAKGIGKVLGE